MRPFRSRSRTDSGVASQLARGPIGPKTSCEDDGRRLGLSGHWSPLVATTAMVRSAVAETVSFLSGFFQCWPDAGVDPLQPLAGRSPRPASDRLESGHRAGCRNPPLSFVV